MWAGHLAGEVSWRLSRSRAYAYYNLTYHKHILIRRACQPLPISHTSREGVGRPSADAQWMCRSIHASVAARRAPRRPSPLPRTGDLAQSGETPSRTRSARPWVSPSPGNGCPRRQGNRLRRAAQALARPLCAADGSLGDGGALTVEKGLFLSRLRPPGQRREVKVDAGEELCQGSLAGGLLAGR